MPERSILVVNTGSSSLKAALFDRDDPRKRILTAQIDHIGHASALRVENDTGDEIANAPLAAVDHKEALTALIGWLDSLDGLDALSAIGHRLVHGGATYSAPARIDDAMIETLQQLIPFAPNHMPQALAAIAATRAAFPNLSQVACFDTAFHRTMPPVAQRYPLPPEFERDGVIRYGFHGLSYASIVDRLGDRIAPRTIVAHLGNGASMTALRDGKSIDTTMGFTPLGGLMMGTRPGDLDPGVLLYLLQQTGRTIDEVADLVTNRSGLRGVSQHSADMKTLLEQTGNDPQTAAALDLYVYLARKQLGGLLAVLGGVDLLVFTGGIGEHAPEIRARIGRDFDFAGIRIDPARNAPSPSSRTGSRNRSSPEHPSPTQAPSPTVILNEVKDLSRSSTPAPAPAHRQPPVPKQRPREAREEILRVAQNDSEGTESATTTGMSIGTEISYSDSPVRVLVIPSDEERMIARDTVHLLEEELS